MPVNSFEDYPMSWKPRIAQTNNPLYIAIAEQLEHDIKGGLSRCKKCCENAWYPVSTNSSRAI
jgi:hypothetical protein